MRVALTLAFAGFSFQAKLNGFVEVRLKSIKPCSRFEKQGFFQHWAIFTLSFGLMAV